MTDDSVLSILQHSYLFRHLTPDRLAQVGARLVARQLAAGELLFRQGDAGDELYIVQEGCIAIFSPDATQPGQEKALRLFGPGELLGEMAVIDRQPRSVSARAELASRLLAFSGDDFRALIHDDPGVALAAMGGLNDRIRYTTDFIGQVRRWIECIAAGNFQAGQFETEMQRWAQDEAGGQTAARDDTLASLAAEFVHMAARVQEREEALQRQVDELRIEIDASKRQRQVDEIVETDYFKSLRSQAADMRRKRGSG